MNVVVRHPPESDQAVSPPVLRAGGVATVKVFERLTAAESYWRDLETGGALATPYQRFDFLAAWQHHVGTRAGITPFVVTGFDAGGSPLFLWPFGRLHVGPLQVVQFLGSKHANFNLGLWRRDLAAAITVDELRALLDSVRQSGPRADLLALYRQPLEWNGVANPFALLPHQASADHGMRLAIDRPGEEMIAHTLSPTTRRRLRGKLRKLESLPDFRYFRATTPEEIDRLLDAFLAAKSIHMAQQGLNNVFAIPGVTEFTRAACHHRLANGRHLIEIHALEGDGEMLAMFAVVADDYRCSSMFNTYTLSKNSRHSPGLILLRQIVADTADRGLRGFDLGVGRAEYKTVFCNEVELLFDTVIGLTPLGKMTAPAMRAASATKRFIKDQPSLWKAVQTLRRLRARNHDDLGSDSSR
jgi:CelD/BcsL family acetyltransferase involved in cellulose biosynthesis